MPEPTYLDGFNFKIFQFVQEHRLLESGDRVVVSVSGGADSVCLFHLLLAFRIKIDLDLYLVHFHHGLRTESDEEARFVSQLASQYDIPSKIVRTSAFKGHTGLQNKARQWRYSQLEETRSTLNFKKIALGHHLDDLVETQIWKLIRGGSLFSLNPIQVKNLPIIRPLLNTPKKEITDYLTSKKLTWREDHSNESTHYTRNLIRHKIIPEMDRSAGGKLAEKFLALNNDASHLKALFDELVPDITYKTKELEFQTISNLNPLLGRELIHRFLIFHGQEEITRANLEKIHQLVLSGKGNWQLSLKKNVRIVGVNKSLKIKEFRGNTDK